MYSQKQNTVAQNVEKILSKYNVIVTNFIHNNERGYYDISSKAAISKNILQSWDKEVNSLLEEIYIKSFAISGLHNIDNNMQYQRIHFIVGDDADQVERIYQTLEENDENDHRNINQRLRVFHIDPLVSPGSITWLPNGMVIVNILCNYIRKEMSNHGYQEVSTPAFANYKLWQKSGHWEMYSENMLGYNQAVENIGNVVDHTYYLLKPMSCPLHGEIMKLMKTSYKSLPLKLFEFGNVYRNESSGALHGLFRARQFTQDDAHIFCKEEHIQQEVLNFCKMLLKMYRKCGFENISVKFSTRPEKFAGAKETWDLAEKILEDSMKKSDFDFEILDGEGAFYGPKLEFHIVDQHGRSWQCGTLQLDLILAERLDLTYIDHDNSAKYPVVIHHAIFGSIERVVGMLMEYNKGWLPLWLAPIQISIATITDRGIESAKKLQGILQNNNFRTYLDDTNNTLGYKIKSATNRFISIIAIIGDKEVTNNSISIRNRDNSSETISYDKIIEYMNNKIIQKALSFE